MMPVFWERSNHGAKQVAMALANGDQIILVGGHRSGKAHFARKVNITLAKIRRLRKGRP